MYIRKIIYNTLTLTSTLIFWLELLQVSRINRVYFMYHPLVVFRILTKFTDIKMNIIRQYLPNIIRVRFRFRRHLVRFYGHVHILFYTLPFPDQDDTSSVVCHTIIIVYWNKRFDLYIAGNGEQWGFQPKVLVCVRK